jgi:beta-lactamase regulating signal transducer with metallopeptidase domain
MIATALLDSLWQGALIFVIAAAIDVFVPKHHAASKYLVWLVALLAIAIVPAYSAFSPQAAYPAMPGVVVKASAVTNGVVTRAADSLSFWLIAAWVAGVAICSGRLLLSGVRIATLLRASTPAPELGSDVRISDDVSIPVAAGLLRPVVVIPSRMLSSLPAVELRALIEHERAHIFRGDIPANLLARIIEAVFFFNPWIYVIGRELVKQREAACDDRAVLATGSADTYAASLASVALSARGTSPLLTPGAAGSKRLLFARITRLLAGKETVVKPNYVPAAICAAVLGVTTLGLSAKGLAQTQTTATSPSNATCNHDVTVLVPQPPDISKADFKPNVSAVALVTVATDGHPQNAKIVKSSGSKAIDDATVSAAMRSTYGPKVSNCVKVAGSYLFHVDTSGK